MKKELTGQSMFPSEKELKSSSQFLLNKKGISDVVATVLVIMITVAAVAIIWSAVIPMIRNSLVSPTERADVSIVTEKGYTAYDPQTKLAIVQVERGQDEVGDNLYGLQFTFYDGGNSYSVNTTSFPTEGTTKTYGFNLTNFSQFTRITIAPIYKSTDRIGVVGSVQIYNGAYGSTNGAYRYQANLSGGVQGVSSYQVVSKS